MFDIGFVDKYFLYKFKLYLIVLSKVSSFDNLF